MRVIRPCQIRRRCAVLCRRDEGYRRRESVAAAVAAAGGYGSRDPKRQMNQMGGCKICFCWGLSQGLDMERDDDDGGGDVHMSSFQGHLATR